MTNETELNVNGEITNLNNRLRENLNRAPLGQSNHDEDVNNEDTRYQDEGTVAPTIQITEADVLAKVNDFIKSIYTYDKSISLYQNKEKAKEVVRQLDNYLRPFGNLPQSVYDLLKKIDLNKIKCPKDGITLEKLLTSKITPLKISGDNYMSIFKGQKYLLNIHQDISEIKNFFYVIDKNDSAILLKGFKDNKQSLINIIVGLIKITLSYKELMIKYEYSYDLVYKNQVFDDVVFDFDYYQSHNQFCFLKKLVTTVVNEETNESETTSKIIKLILSESDLKRCDLKIKSENVRNTDEMVAEEIPEPFEIFVYESKEFENAEITIFSKEKLETFVKNKDFRDKIFNFIDGAILIYPEILDSIPDNIKLKEDEFHIFKYISGTDKGADVEVIPDDKFPTDDDLVPAEIIHPALPENKNGSN